VTPQLLDELEESILDDHLECWAGVHGAEVRVLLVCCDKEAFGCVSHYERWRLAWEVMAAQAGFVDCKSCKQRFDSVDQAIHVHTI